MDRRKFLKLTFTSASIALISPTIIKDFFNIKRDEILLPENMQGIFIGNGGNLGIKTKDKKELIITNIKDGTILPIIGASITLKNTTVKDIVIIQQKG